MFAAFRFYKHRKEKKKERKKEKEKLHNPERVPLRNLKAIQVASMSLAMNLITDAFLEVKPFGKMN